MLKLRVSRKTSEFIKRNVPMKETAVEIRRDELGNVEKEIRCCSNNALGNARRALLDDLNISRLLLL